MVSLGKHGDLIHILSKARRFQCSDPRDKVYALLGLLRDHVRQKPRFQPVYKNSSGAEAYIFTAIQILEDVDDFLLIAHVEGEEFQVVEGLPSWVPDWSCGKGVGLGNWKFIQPNLPLVIGGWQLDRVVQADESKDEALIHRKNAYFPGWFSILSAFTLVYHTGQPRAEVFWRTLITDTAARAFQPPRHPTADEYRFAFRSWLEHIILCWVDEPQSVEKRPFLEDISKLAALGTPHAILGKDLLPNISDELENSDSVPLSADDYDAVLNHSSQTRLLRARKNHLDLATTSARVDDLIWIVPGSRVPLILRETDSPNGYRSVGGAYVHDFMQGEALVSHAVLTDIKIV